MRVQKMTRFSLVVQHSKFSNKTRETTHDDTKKNGNPVEANVVKIVFNCEQVVTLQWSRSYIDIRVRTPSEDDVNGDGTRICKQRQENQVVQVQALHEDPRVIGHDKVLPQARHQFALPL